MLEIVYSSKNVIAINKPAGLLVHPTPLARDADTSALQLLRDQIGKYVFPVHRLDRKTSGVLLFALNKTHQAALNTQFKNGLVEKTYQAIVRGYIEDSGIIEYELTNDRNKKQKAITHIQCLQRTEIPLPFGKHKTSRYSWVELSPKTGRQHQLRKHMAHVLHPIIGDRPHGCNKQNKLFKERFELMQMMLHAKQLDFEEPETKERISIKAKRTVEFDRILKALNFVSEPT